MNMRRVLRSTGSQEMLLFRHDAPPSLPTSLDVRMPRLFSLGASLSECGCRWYYISICMTWDPQGIDAAEKIRPPPRKIFHYHVLKLENTAVYAQAEYMAKRLRGLPFRQTSTRLEIVVNRNKSTSAPDLGVCCSRCTTYSSNLRFHVVDIDFILLKQTYRSWRPLA